MQNKGDNPVRILCAANAAYAVPLCVMLTSLVMNRAKGRGLEIHVLATNVPEEDRGKIEASLRKNCPDFNLENLHWLSPSLEEFQELPVTEYADIEVYSRLLAPKVLPSDWDKVLYLDCDMVILEDLSPLYDMACNDSAVHAVRDQIGLVSETHGVFNFAEMGIPPNTPYFNSGVLLINLRHWRQHNVTGRVFDYLNKHQKSVACWDQGGLNAILHNSWTELDPTWNQMRCSLQPERWKQLGRSMSDWKRTITHPKIIHYTDQYKPWISDRLPGYSYFFKYLKRTDYRGTFQGPRLELAIGFRLNYYLWRLDKYFRDLPRRIKSKLGRLFGKLGFLVL
jgi:lipopolysaccharide biosynthesis glycosyltransferase